MRRKDEKMATKKRAEIKCDGETLLRNFHEIEISSVVAADWNYKEEDAELQKVLESQMRRNGQIENIIVRKIGNGMWEAVNGNHRLRAFRNLGYETALCYDLGEVSLDEAKRVAIETGETRFQSDKLKLAQLLSELTEEFSSKDLSVTMPYSEQEIDNTKQILNFDWTDKSKRMRCPKCKKTFKAQ